MSKVEGKRALRSFPPRCYDLSTPDFVRRVGMSMLTTKDTNPDPVTAAEVEGWFRETTKRRKLPDVHTCAVFAQMLQDWRAGGKRHDHVARQRWLHVRLSAEAERERKAWDKAAGVLRARMNRVRQAADSGLPTPVSVLLAVNGLEAALIKAGGWFGRLGSELPRVVWHEIAHTILHFYQEAFSFDGPKPGTASPIGPAVRFTKLALDRLGFNEATPAAIAELGRTKALVPTQRSAGTVAPK